MVIFFFLMKRSCVDKIINWIQIVSHELEMSQARAQEVQGRYSVEGIYIRRSLFLLYGNKFVT